MIVALHATEDIYMRLKILIRRYLVLKNDCIMGSYDSIIAANHILSSLKEDNTVDDIEVVLCEPQYVDTMIYRIGEDEHDSWLGALTLEMRAKPIE